ncbi:MAG: hypothetical protein R3B52_01785 [Candidatus Paceibacterota bacterium]
MARKKYSTGKKTKAANLRKKGESFGEIAKKLKISKSTAKLWTEKVALDSRLKKALYTKGVQTINQGEANARNRREKELREIKKQAKKEIKGDLSDTSIKLLGAMLYWAEGDKQRQIAFTNSDVKMVVFFVQWLKKVFRIPPSKLTARINFYENQREKDLKKYWSEKTGIPIKNFQKSYIKPQRARNYKRNRLYYGTIRIRVPKSADMHYRIFAWIDRLLEKKSPL